MIKGSWSLEVNNLTEFDAELFKKRAKDWLEFSAVSRAYPPSFSHNLRKSHGGIKPPELIFELTYAFAPEATNVLDPFVGVGSTLLASSLLKKNATGIDVNQNWKSIYQQVCEENKLSPQNFIIGDSAKILKKYEDHSFDFCITDIPYFSMDKLKKTRGKFSKAGEPSKEKLKSSLKVFNELPVPTYEEWIILLKNVFKEVFRIVNNKAIVIIFIGNMYRNFETIVNDKKKKVGKYLLLSTEVSEILVNIGFQHVNELIWVDTGKKLGIYGYPYTWIPSLIDQRILIFRKSSK